MRNTLLLLCFTMLFYSCKSGFEHNKAGLEKLGTELMSEFGADAYYTDMEIINNQGSDDVIMITQTKDPASMKQEQWAQYHGAWEKQADVTFTADGAAPKSFMFQLNREASLSTLGSLLETSEAQLAKEKQVEKPLLVMASIKSNNKMNTKESGIFYYITLRDPKAQKDYRFIYNLKGASMLPLEGQ